MKVFLNEKGSTLVGAIVATSIITMALFAFQKNFLRSTEDLNRLKIKTIKRMIITNLKISALSVTALKKTKERNNKVKNCIDLAGTCEAKTWHKINWYDSTAKMIAGSTSENRAIRYDKEGVNCQTSTRHFSIRTASTGSNPGTYGYTKRKLAHSYDPGGSISGDFPEALLGINRHNNSSSVWIIFDNYSEYQRRKGTKVKIDGATYNLIPHPNPSGEHIRRDNVDGYEFKISGSNLGLGKTHQITFLNSNNEAEASSDQCPFGVLSYIKFYCINDANRCPQADSAEVKYELHTALSDNLAGGGNYEFRVTIPRVTPQVIQTTETRYTNTYETRHTSSTNTNYIQTGGGGGGGDGGGDGDGNN